MTWIFYGTPSRGYEQKNYQALKRKAPFKVDFKPASEFKKPEADGAIVQSLQIARRAIMEGYGKAGLPVLYFDKGYIVDARGASRMSSWRIALNATQPTRHMRRRDDLRLSVFGDMKLTRPGAPEQIVLAGSSERYHRWHALTPPDVYWSEIATVLAHKTQRPLVYRPKPKIRNVGPINGALFDHGRFRKRTYLNRAHALVTHGSGAAVDAILAGVPVFILGDHPASLLGMDNLDLIETPHIYSDDERHQWLCDLSYWQWTTQEMMTAAFWDHVLETIEQYAA